MEDKEIRILIASFIEDQEFEEDDSISIKYKKISFVSKCIYEKCNIEVIQGDSIDVAKNYFNPVILNMANYKYPGGGWKKGFYAQEESLFLRTTLSKTLDYSFYPILDVSGIYSKNVLVIRDNNLKELKEKNKYKTSFITVAALPCHSHNIDDEIFDKMTMKKISLMFKIAIANGHKNIILGAFGCGAYKNPVFRIIYIFNEIIRKYKQYFESIVFAIISKEESEKRYFNFDCDEKMDNYTLFDKYINRD